MKEEGNERAMEDVFPWPLYSRSLIVPFDDTSLNHYTWKTSGSVVK